MPAITRKSETPARARSGESGSKPRTLQDLILMGKLSTVLRRSGLLPGEPLVVENRIGQTRSMHVAVIWDKWKNLSPTDRSKIILDAYAKAHRLPDSVITVAMGLTGEEAFRMGFLPYSIVTTRRQGDKATFDELAEAMVSVGGMVVKVGSAVQVRFPTSEMAEDAYRELSQKVPGPYWAIVHDQSASE